jgi:hypothetical protein
MSSTQINVAETIASYLAGRLSASEAEAFERQLSEHPEVRDEIELTLKLKEGLTRLNERGELKGLLQAPPARRWLTYAAAATVAIATLGAVLWLQLRSHTPAVLAQSLKELAAPHHELPSVVATYVLARTRGGAPAAEVPLPDGGGAIELRVLPSVFSPTALYRAGLRRVGGVKIAQIDAALAAPDGYVTIYVDSRALTPGEYEVSLAEAVPQGTNANSDRFVIRVR